MHGGVKIKAWIICACCLCRRFSFCCSRATVSQQPTWHRWLPAIMLKCIGQEALRVLSKSPKMQLPLVYECEAMYVLYLSPKLAIVWSMFRQTWTFAHNTKFLNNGSSLKIKKCSKLQQGTLNHCVVIGLKYVIFFLIKTCHRWGYATCDIWLHLPYTLYDSEDLGL